LLLSSCSRGSDGPHGAPLAPGAPGPGVDGPSEVGALNLAPALVVRTQPAAVPGAGGDPVVRTRGTVTFNACASRDPDAADSLNWQFHFGDSGRPAFDDEGRFQADVARSCRAEHAYAPGRYTATVSVTDKHLEDQGGGYAALARAAARFTIVATGDDAEPRRCTAAPIVEGFDAYAVGTPSTALTVPGLVFSGDGVVVRDHVWSDDPAARALNGNLIAFKLDEARDHLRFRFSGVSGWAVTVGASYRGKDAFGGRYVDVRVDRPWQDIVIEHRGTLFDAVFMTSGTVHIDDLELSCE
jgi:hypothetical protein